MLYSNNSVVCTTLFLSYFSESDSNLNNLQYTICVILARTILLQFKEYFHLVATDYTFPSSTLHCQYNHAKSKLTVMIFNLLSQSMERLKSISVHFKLNVNIFRRAS